MEKLVNYSPETLSIRPTYVFVGENRSQTAQDKGYSWEFCQQSSKPVLCAIRLFDALNHYGLDPRNQIIVNLWDDNNQLISDVLSTLQQLSDTGEIIIGMGKRVQQELEKYSIPHRKLIHPAARGKIASKSLYRQHLKEILTD